MDLYNIPGDTGSPWRQKKFLSLLKQDYIDGATDYCLLVPFAYDFNLNNDQRMWLAYLYGLSYSCTTAIRVFHAFPDFSSISLKELKKFWNAHRSTLWFNPDRKYIQNNNQFIEAIKSFRKSMGSHPYETYIHLITDAEQPFEALYKTIKKEWKYFGPMGAYLFLDAVYGLLPEDYVDPIYIDWSQGGKTVVQGMAHFAYSDELIESSKYPLETYNQLVDKIQQKTHRPKVIIDSTLCAFRKLFKQTRYVGYYADRMLEEVYATQEYAPKGVDFWDYRARTIPHKFRGEELGWKGIRKNKLKDWVSRGEL